MAVDKSVGGRSSGRTKGRKFDGGGGARLTRGSRPEEWDVLDRARGSTDSGEEKALPDSGCVS